MIITRRKFLGGVILIPTLVAFNISPLDAAAKPISALTNINNKRLIQRIVDDLVLIHEPYILELNDSHTRELITNACDQYLYSHKNNRLLHDFVVRCDVSNNPPAFIDEHKLRTDVSLQISKTVGFIYIPITMEPSI